MRDNFTLFFVIAWKICGGRNRHIYDGSTTSLKIVIENALAYQGLLPESQEIPPHSLKCVGCWLPLEFGFCKLNVDGALFSDLRMAGIGAILRNSHGEVLFASSMKEQDIQEPGTIKTLTILRGLQLNMHLGVTHFLLELDCQLVTKEVQGNGEPTFTLDNLIQDIKELMTRFQQCSIQFSYKQCNEAAHYLARNASNINHVVWQGEIPNFLVHTIWLDKQSCKSGHF